jgi:hypothetical protein
VVIAMGAIMGQWKNGKIKGVGCGTYGDEEHVNQKDLILMAEVEQAEKNGEAYYFCDFCGKRLIHCGDE